MKTWAVRMEPRAAGSHLAATRNRDERGGEEDKVLIFFEPLGTHRSVILLESSVSEHIKFLFAYTKPV